MRLARLALALALVAPLAAADEKKDACPVNPFAAAAVGDWELLALKGDKERFEEWTVTKVEGDKVTVKIVVTGVEKPIERVFSTKEAPSLGDFFPEKPAACEDASSGRATLPLEGQEFRGEKVKFKATFGEAKKSGVLYVSDEVKGAGIIQRELVAGEKASIVGHGTKEKTIWGRARDKKDGK